MLRLTGTLIALALASAAHSAPGAEDETRETVAPIDAAASPARGGRGDITVEVGQHTQTVTAVAGDARGRWVATVSLDKTLRIWALPSRELVRTIRPPDGPGVAGALRTVAMSPDGERIAVSGTTSIRGLGFAIFVFERSSGRMLRRIDGAPHRIAQLAWSPDGRLLAAALAGATGLQVYRGSDYAAVGAESGFAKGAVSLDFNAQGRLAVLTGDDELRLYSTTGDRLQRLASASTLPARGGLRMRFSPDGTQIAATFKASAEIVVFAAATLERMRRIAPPNTSSVPSGPIEWEADSAHVVAAIGSPGHSLLGRWPGPQDTLAGKTRVFWQWLEASERQTQPLGTIVDLRRTGAGLLLATTLPGWTLVAPGDSVMGETAPASIPALAAAFSADGRQLLVRLSADNLGKSGMAYGRSAVFALADLSLRPPTAGDRGFGPAQHGAVLAVGANGLRRTLDAGQDVWRIELPAAVVEHHVSADYRLLVVQLADGSFRWYRYDDGRPLFSLFVHPDGQRWAMWTLDGAYTGAAGGEALLGRSLSHGLDAPGELVGLGRGTERPDRAAVLAAIATAAAAPTPAQARAAGGNPDPTAAPQLRLMAPASGARVDRPLATLRFVVDSATAAAVEPFTHVRVRIDDLPPYIVDRAELRPVQGTAAYDLDVRIEAAQTRIELVAMAFDRASAPVRLNLSSSVRTVQKNGSYWAEKSLWNPGTRRLESCQALLDLRDSLGGYRSHVDKLLAEADRQLVATGRPGTSLSSAVEVRRVMELETIATMALALSSQWAGAEEFVRMRQARRLPPIGRDDSPYTAAPKKEALALREQVLAVLLEAAAARGQLPEAAFDDAIRRAGPILLDAALVLSVPPEAALRGSYARPGASTTLQLSTAMKTVRSGRLENAGGEVRKAAVATRKQLADAFSGRVCEPRSQAAGGAGPAELSSYGQDLAEQLATMRHAVRTLVQAAAAGTLLETIGQLDEAYALLEPTYAITLASLGPSHPLTLEARAALARVQGGRNRLVDARALWAGWIQASQQALSDEIWMVDEATRREVLRNNRRNVDGFLSALLRAAPDDAAAQALALSIARKGLLARVAGELNGLARTSRDPAARELVARVEQQRREVAGLLFRPGADPAVVQRERARLSGLEAALAAKVRARRNGGALPTVAELRQTLAADEALIDFQVYRDPPGASGERPPARLLAVLLRKSGEPVLLQWPDLGEIGAAVAQYLALIDPDSAPTALRLPRLRAVAANLTRLIWAPVEAHLGGIRRIDLVPDGPLSLVPFHALGAGDAGYVAARYELTVLASPRDLVLRQPPTAPGRALVVGAPDYGPAGGNGGNGSRTIVPVLQDLVFEPLPGALEESRKVAAIVGRAYPVDLLTGERASEAAMYRAAGPPVLHLATHGFFLQSVTEAEAGDDPMQALTRAGVSLAHANAATRGSTRGGDDGILTALEATTLDLRGTRLVVLSACDTGLGQIEAGEGVHGLVRAFGEAGAQAVLATLWPVDDEATREFMLGFYRRFVAGESPQAALRAMQLEFIRSREWSDPHYWAPFVVVGR